MAFGRAKKSAENSINQQNVAMLATAALQKARSTRVRLVLRLVFNRPLLMHRWSQKPIMQMVGAMVGVDLPRGKKDLTAEYEASGYRNINGVPALPCRIIKAAIVDGAIDTDGVTSKAELKRSLRVLGCTAPLKLNGGPIEMDLRIASNNGRPDMRARAIAPAGTSCEIVLEFPPSLTPDKVIAAVTGAGNAIGLCDFRPEKGGEYGVFDVEVGDNSPRGIDRVLKDCAPPEETYKIPPEMLRAFNAIPADDLGAAGARLKKIVNGDGGRRAGAAS